MESGHLIAWLIWVGAILLGGGAFALMLRFPKFPRLQKAIRLALVTLALMFCLPIAWGPETANSNSSSAEAQEESKAWYMPAFPLLIYELARGDQSRGGEPGRILVYYWLAVMVLGVAFYGSRWLLRWYFARHRLKKTGGKAPIG